ncbi:MAG: helix-turn-helix transcriptional regulator [Candidatus Saccharicenans sp.]|jgi:transcriptional regulator with XRE-family HTH domain|nr:helix-turn-helix transcriptional regulator [Candidatus Saccharicenans sp.]MDH7493457.1 helix-turn-helix transcriptional regulator [Candidatus Saccharicenans sp.]
MAIKTTFGEYLKEKRIEKGFTLREFCKKYGLDPGNVSKLERGLLPPPASRKKLEEYATFLGLKKGTDEWMEFFDRAATSRGELPKDLLDDEVLKALPVILRTIRGKKVSREMLNELIDKIRRT